MSLIATGRVLGHFLVGSIALLASSLLLTSSRWSSWSLAQVWKRR